MAALKREGFRLADIGDVDSFVAATRVLPFVHRNGIGLDLALSGPGIEEAMHARAVSRRLGSVVVRLIEINDLLTLKLLAGRPKDLEDVRALIRIDPDGLDRSKVETNLTALQQALDVSDLVPRLDDLWPC